MYRILPEAIIILLCEF